MPDDPTTEMEISFDELRAELSERGQLEFELATLRATNRKLVAMVRSTQSEEK